MQVLLHKYFLLGKTQTNYIAHFPALDLMQLRSLQFADGAGRRALAKENPELHQYRRQYEDLIIA
jgi:hypothetical protein